MKECAWCENLLTCLPFSDYVSRHRHGQCLEWVDSEIAKASSNRTCRNCSLKRSCTDCLNTFNCGWCGNRNNPTIGICYEGDFSGTPFLSHFTLLIFVYLRKVAYLKKKLFWDLRYSPFSGIAFLRHFIFLRNFLFLFEFFRNFAFHFNFSN